MRRESDFAEEKAPAKGEGGAEGATRARKRKADVATFLQDPDEEIAQMEMNRKKQYENQACSYHVLYCSGQEGYQPWLMKNAKHFSSCSRLWSLCKRQDLYRPKPVNTLNCPGSARVHLMKAFICI